MQMSTSMDSKAFCSFVNDSSDSNVSRQWATKIFHHTYSLCKEIRYPVCHRLLVWYKSVWTHYGSAAPFECWSIKIDNNRYIMLWMLYLNADLHGKRHSLQRPSITIHKCHTRIQDTINNVVLRVFFSLKMSCNLIIIDMLYNCIT